MSSQLVVRPTQSIATSIIFFSLSDIYFNMSSQQVNMYSQSTEAINLFPYLECLHLQLGETSTIAFFLSLLLNGSPADEFGLTNTFSASDLVFTFLTIRFNKYTYYLSSFSLFDFLTYPITSQPVSFIFLRLF